MAATINTNAPQDNPSITLSAETTLSQSSEENSKNNLSLPSQLLAPNRHVLHHPKAGLNPLADAAGSLLSMLGKLKQIKSYHGLQNLQKELMQEINTFTENVKNLSYNAEYLIISRYVICATFDDIITETTWGSQGEWDSHSLVTALNQDTHHHDRFFNILERAIQEPAHYIDLMELMYVCLSFGYKGHYRTHEQRHFLLEQIINNLYNHIRAYRGNFSKTLSPTPLRTPKLILKAASKFNTSPLVIFLVTACIIMTIFAGLGYLMDVISNEAYKNIKHIQTPVFYETSK